ncbi:LIV-I protein F [Variovorax sp. SRS16]|uniref:ATP-binding cassette domain-containing protein n=1 Tax=Variovorax sp. SRS16 TaxID=282217 RepID=UPI001317D9E8|nr:ATP-binding cassette domain-containing protein [Variovorax sp. SRS16]VTU13813.1 LIV-I protein F [Variovorax sp. SRS16]
MTEAFVFDGVVAGYGDTTVLRGIGGAVRPGCVLGVLGRNGVGKTTLMRALAGFLPLMSGSVRFGPRELAKVPAHARLAAGIAYSPQEDTVFTELSVGENLRLHLADGGMARYAPYFEAFPRLAERGAQRAGSLSGGERKLLAFTRTLALDAAVTLMDEPTEGVQPENIERMSRLVRARCEAGAGFVIVEQNLSFVLRTADEVLLLDHGEAVLAGPIGGFSRSDLEGRLVV